MKKKLCFLFLGLMSLAFIFAGSNKKMYVAVEEATVKEKGSIFSKSVGNLLYGEVVFAGEQKGKWTYIQSEDSSISGWISTTSLTKKKLVSKGDRVTASTEELALAGKGFSAEFEEDYKRQGKADFDAVDELEKNVTSQDELYDFIVEGNLEVSE